MSDLSGQSLGRYQLIEKLGEGGMAVVYKAYDTRLQCNIALKLIRKEKFTSDSTSVILKRFENEALQMAQLTHPNIVPVIDYGDIDGTPYIAMKYISGGTLKDLCGTQLPYTKAIKLILPIAKALKYANEHGIIHRDVKPANILITENDEPMLSDFGIAKIINSENVTHDTLTQMGIGIGTPEYMSPEQANGKTLDTRSDLYSLGVVLFELITGQKPFTADTPLSVLIKQISEDSPHPNTYVKNIPVSVDSLLLKSLAKDPKKRYQTMDEFIAAMEMIIDKSNKGVFDFSTNKKIFLFGIISAFLLISTLWFSSKQDVIDLKNSIQTLFMKTPLIQNGNASFELNDLTVNGQITPTLSISPNIPDSIFFIDNYFGTINELSITNEVSPVLINDQYKFSSFIYDKHLNQIIAVTKNKDSVIFIDSNSGQIKRTISSDSTDPICSVAVTSNGRRLVIGYHGEKDSVYLHELWASSPKQLLSTDPGLGDFEVLIYENSTLAILMDNNLLLYSLDDYSQTNNYLITGLIPNPVVFSPDGKTLYSIQYGSIISWNVITMALNEISVIPDPIETPSLVISKDGTLLWVASQNHLYEYDMDLRLLKTFSLNFPINQLLISSNGLTLYLISINQYTPYSINNSVFGDPVDYATYFL